MATPKIESLASTQKALHIAGKESTMAKTTGLVWTQVDVKTLSKTSAPLYNAMVAANKAASEAAEAFRTKFIPELIALEVVEKDANIVVSNRFGKLSFAIAPEKEAKSSKPLLSMKK